MARQRSTARESLRSLWKGFINFGLVTIPVKAFPAKKTGGGKIDLDWLHASCHSHIHYEKVCPRHGRVRDDEIVSGYKYGRGYVVIEPDELEKLRTPSDHALNIQEFIAPDKLDLLYCTDRTYYLLPDGPAGAKPYTVFQRVLKRHERWGIAQAVLFKREQVVALRPEEDLLVMTVLSYADRFRDPVVFRKSVPETTVSSHEMDLARLLMDNLTNDKFDFSKYEDTYSDKLRALVEAKAKGREIEAPPEEEEPVALNFMEALKKSVAAARAGTSAHASGGRQHRRRKVS